MKSTIVSMLLATLKVFTHFCYRFPGTGLPRLSEFVRRKTAAWANRYPENALVWINDFCGNQKFCCDLSEHMGSQIYFRGSYSGDQLIILRKLLTPDSVFLDVGANQGEFTVCAAACIPKGQIFAFEPEPNVLQRLKKNIAANCYENVNIFSVGLSNANRENVAIYGADVTYTDGTQNIGLPTIFNMSGRGELLAQVSLMRLDDVLSPMQRVDVIKIDVEGSELFVLQGAECTIQREKPSIIFEANAATCKSGGYAIEDIFTWLTMRGYDLAVIGEGGILEPINQPTSFCNMLAFQPRAIKIK